MFVWVGVDVDEQLQEIKSVAKEAEERIGFVHSNFTLPLHVSLKMSFAVDEKEFDAVVETLAGFFKTLSPIDVGVKGIELLDGIVWIRLQESEALNAVHDQLNDLLSRRFGVGLHAYDCDYQFHTTLFMDRAQEKLERAHGMVMNAPLPPAFCLRRFVIGCSSSGELGSYRVYRRIDRER